MIIDGCLYYNESELWAGRVETLADVVDAFVVIEADRTHQGERHQPTFDVDRWRAELGDRLIHRVCELPPLPNGDRGGVGSPSYQVLERMQRDAIISAVDWWVGPDDVLMVSDVDEIPDPESVRLAAELVRAGELGVEISGYMDCYAIGWRFPARWLGTTAASVGRLRAERLSASVLRDLRGSGKLATVKSEWVHHLTWLGGVEASVAKQASFSHAELNYRTADDFAAKIAEGVDSNGVKLAAVPLGEEYPPFVREGRLPHSWYRGELREQVGRMRGILP